MLLPVIAISCLIVVNATPLGRIGVGVGLAEDLYGIDEVGYGGRGRGGIRGKEVHSGSENRRRGSEGMSKGYGSREHEFEDSSDMHDKGHVARDFKKIEESHTSESHDRGRSERHRSRDSDRDGHSRYNARDENMGRRSFDKSIL